MSALSARIGGVGSTFAAFVRRDFVVALSYRLPFILDLFGSTVQLLLFFFIGEIVDPTDLSGDVGASSGYFPFVVIGLVMTRIVDTALRSFSSKLRGEQMTGTFEALIATPASLPTLVLGSAAYNLFDGVVTGSIMLLIAVVFGLRFDVSVFSLVGGALGLIASLAFFAAIGVAVAAFIVVYKQGQGVLSMVTSVIGLLGGAYFPVDVLPGPVQALAAINPLKWSLDVLRAALLEREVLWGSLCMLAVAAAALLPCALWLLRVAVDRARRDGSLAQY